MALEVVPLRTVRKLAWSEFCRDEPTAWFWHTPAWHAYCLDYTPGAVDCSWAVLRDGGLAAVAPALLEPCEDGRHVVGLGRVPAPEPAGPLAERAARAILEDAKTLPVEFRSLPGIRRVGHPVSNDECSFDRITRRSLSTRVVDLPPAWSDVRDSYKSLVTRGLRSYHVAPAAHVYDVAVWCRSIHREAAGRATRSQATWNWMAQWVVTHQALCLTARELRAGRAVGYALWLVDKRHAYYASGATLRDDVGHALIWASLLALAARGVRTAELGWQGWDATEEGRGIEFFKRGFGGGDVPITVTTYHPRRRGDEGDDGGSDGREAAAARADEPGGARGGAA